MKLTYYCDTSRHLICLPYSRTNLHQMGRELGIKKCWYHRSKTGLYHYDIPKNRIQEITKKCIVVETTELIKLMRNGQ